MHDAHEAAEFALHGLPDAQAPAGTLSRAVIARLIAPLSSATNTPDICYAALWEGFGDSIVSEDVAPTLELPHRRYHVFGSRMRDARSSYSRVPFSYRSANLWWPADQAWCVATEVDAAWTYIAASQSTIDTLLGDPDLDATATAADAPW